VGADARPEPAALQPLQQLAATSGDGPLDPAVLESLLAISGGSRAMLDRIFRMFQGHAPARLAALEEALAANDLGRAASRRMR
jgi:hypothetical protein